MFAGTGIAGLDEVLGGGVSLGKTHLVMGAAGVGKTTLGLQFALEGVRRGEPVVTVALSETRKEINEAATWHGWSLDAVTVLERSDLGGGLTARPGTSMFHPSEVELGQTIHSMLEKIDRHSPVRVIIDSLAEIRALAQGELDFRRQILELKDYFVVRGWTVLLLDDLLPDPLGGHLQSIVHGVLLLEQIIPQFGPERRRLKVLKMRTQIYASGHHDYVISRGGIGVFPRLVPVTSSQKAADTLLSSHVTALDQLLGGGLRRGTSTLLLGPSGTGKTTVATRYAVAAAERGEKASMLLFDENLETLRERSKQLGMDLTPHVASGALELHEVDPAANSPGQIAQLVRSLVERPGTSTVLVIDSLNSYLDSVLRGEDRPEMHLHELLVYLAKHGVVTIMVQPQLGLLGSHMATPVETSYMIDSMLLFRYFEWRGQLRRTLSVVKQRSGAHENTVRELMLGGREGLKVGGPLGGFEGVLTGNPRIAGQVGERHHPREDDGVVEH